MLSKETPGVPIVLRAQWRPEVSPIVRRRFVPFGRRLVIRGLPRVKESK